MMKSLNIAPDQEGPLVTLVVAVAENGVIGRDGGLAWRISDDLKWFKRRTMGKPIIMGRKTFDSIGRALPGRENIVISRNPHFKEKGVVLSHSIDIAMSSARSGAEAVGAVEMCIIGGAHIYEQMIERADRIYFTKVCAEVEGDVFFPAFDPADWRKVKVGGCRQSEKNEYSCEFFIFDRLAKAKE